MLEKIGNTLIVGVKFYGSTGAGITGLTDITTYVYKLTVSGTTITKTTVMNGVNQATANMIEVDRGLYAFPILAADLGQECVVFYQCETATSTVTNKTEAAAYTVGKAGVEYLDYSIQSVDNDVQTTYNAANSASTSAASANTAASLAASRLGAFLGTGTNTVLGFFQALFRANASTPSGIGGTFNPATDSLEAIRDRGDAAWTTGNGGATVSDILTALLASYDDTAGSLAQVLLAILAKTNTIGANFTYTGPVSPTGRVTVYRGTDYHAGDGTALTWAYNGTVDLTGGTVTLDIDGTQYAGVIGGSSGAWTISVNLTAAQTTALALGPHPYEIRAVLATSRKPPPLGVGTLDVKADR